MPPLAEARRAAPRATSERETETACTEDGIVRALAWLASEASGAFDLGVQVMVGGVLVRGRLCSIVEYAEHFLEAVSAPGALSRPGADLDSVARLFIEGLAVEEACGRESAGPQYLYLRDAHVSRGEEWDPPLEAPGSVWRTRIEAVVGISLDGREQ